MWYNVISLAGTTEISLVSFEDRAHPMQRCAHHPLDSVFTFCTLQPSHPLTHTSLTLHTLTNTPPHPHTPSLSHTPQLRHFFVSNELHFGVYALMAISPGEEVTLAFDFRYDKWSAQQDGV